MPLAHSGWSGWISINGEELPQYSVKVKERPGLPPDIPKFYIISAWISSQVGKEFSIHIECDEKIKCTSDCSAKVDLDGRRIRRGKYINKDMKSITMSGEMETERIERPFAFAALGLTDQETIGKDSNPEQIGTIKIQLFRSRLISDRVEEFSDVPFSAGSLTIHETAKKAASHCVSLGPPRPQLDEPIRTFRTRDIDKGSFLTFIFYYASADILCAQEIIPTVAAGLDAESIGSSSNPIVIDDASEDEDEQLNAIEKLIQKTIEALKKEKEKLKVQKRKKSASDKVGPVKRPKIGDVQSSKIRLETKLEIA